MYCKDAYFENHLTDRRLIKDDIIDRWPSEETEKEYIYHMAKDTRNLVESHVQEQQHQNIKTHNQFFALITTYYPIRLLFVDYKFLHFMMQDSSLYLPSFLSATSLSFHFLSFGLLMIVTLKFKYLVLVF